jgi:hypothetical protein
MMHQFVCCLMGLVVLVADEAPPHIQKYLARCQNAGVKSVALPLPPSRDDLGTLDSDKPAVRKGRGVLVLEVVDGDEAIVRAWHPAPNAPQDRPLAEDDLTFVDLLLEGTDTSALKAGMPAKLEQVYHVAGSREFDTTCGKRSLPLLTPIDVDLYREQ